MKCPVCKSSTGGYYWEPVQRDDVAEELVKQGLLDPKALLTVWHEHPLYQRSYVVAPRKGLITCHIMEEGEEPISPRCHSCYKKAVRKAVAKKTTKKKPRRKERTPGTQEQNK